MSPPDRQPQHPGDDALARVVDLARLAPSIHNTQPWTWVAVDGSLELWADRRRGLPGTDPDGRDLVISCGAALHHALVAARALGLRPVPQHLPDDHEPDHLATVRLRVGTAPSTWEEDLQALRDRYTDRRRFTRWPVPADRVGRLARTAASWGAAVTAVLQGPARTRVEELVAVARTAAQGDRSRLLESRLWVDHGPDDGIPRAAVPAGAAAAGAYAHRFGGEPPGPETRPVAPTDGLAVVATRADDVSDWLTAGETLSSLWLEATKQGLSVVPLSQPVEHPPTRAALAAELTGTYVVPQILVRLGWQEIGRSTLPRTPRRPLAEVLRRGEDLGPADVGRAPGTPTTQVS